jgi:hypothetical protein
MMPCFIFERRRAHGANPAFSAHPTYLTETLQTTGDTSLKESKNQQSNHRIWDTTIFAVKQLARFQPWNLPALSHCEQGWQSHGHAAL